MYHIEDFAALANTSRREVDRMALDGDVEKIKWHGVTLVPAECLSQFPSEQEPEREQPERGEQQAGGITSSPEAETEPRPGTTPATPWEELTYEAL